MRKNLSTLAGLAFAAEQPGETPTDALLTALARTGDEEVPIATLASLAPCLRSTAAHDCPRSNSWNSGLTIRRPS